MSRTGIRITLSFFLSVCSTAPCVDASPPLVAVSPRNQHPLDSFDDVPKWRGGWSARVCVGVMEHTAGHYCICCCCLCSPIGQQHLHPLVPSQPIREIKRRTCLARGGTHRNHLFSLLLLFLLYDNNAQSLKDFSPHMRRRIQ